MSTALLEPGNGSALSSSDEFDLFADLRKELEELSAANREILDELRSDPTVSLESAQAETPVYTAAQWQERELAHEAALEEKVETIRKLEAELTKIRDEGLPELSPEEVQDAVVKRLRAQLEERRRQFDEDEANLMRQMRDMELALAKDRADLARQRAELNRLHSDFQRELEHASRDSQLRDRLVGLQRRHLESQNKRGSDPEVSQATTATCVALPKQTPAQAAQAPERGKQPSGLFRRLFGA
jgi:chromosome segregation ATPase